MVRFPDGFAWGAATSSHQVEGGQQNDWSEWEKKGLTTDRSVSGAATGHFERYDADFALAQSLHHTAHRFSIEWSRVEPTQGGWNEEAIEHYRAVVRALIARGMTPYVTLWHFTNPLWFSQGGGWERRDAPALFARYAARMTAAMPEVTNWITINEANVYALLSYLIRFWPPEVSNPLRAYRVFRHFERAHQAAFGAMKRENPRVHIGSAHAMSAFDPASDRPADRWATTTVESWYNERWLKTTAGTSDFFGINHYTRQDVRFRSFRQPIIAEFTGEPKSDFGWQIYPEGMYRVLTRAARYRKPIIITENGIADGHDRWRAQYIRDYLAQVHRAIRDGVDVRGYLHWSLLDNFEWREGFSQRFGLIAVDYSTLARTVRPSARAYAEICAANALAV